MIEMTCSLDREQQANAVLSDRMYGKTNTLVAVGLTTHSRPFEEYFFWYLR